jgi:hypothetical protein
MIKEMKKNLRKNEWYFVTVNDDFNLGATKQTNVGVRMI